MNYPTCDNDCTKMDWVEYYLTSVEYELHVSIPPNSDLNGTFKAFCHDRQEMLNVNGWLFSAEKVD